jgi:hypothetical protein
LVDARSVRVKSSNVDGHGAERRQQLALRRAWRFDTLARGTSFAEYPMVNAVHRPRMIALPCLCFFILISAKAVAQTDEIQIFTGEINKPGELSLTLHNNYTPSGRRMATFPGGVVPDHALNGSPEFGYGLTEWWEIGAHVPAYTVTRDGRFEADSIKLRSLFVVPHAAERDFFYGVNFEFSYNAPHWQMSRFSGEIRPIVGVRYGPVDLVLNPIVDYDFTSIATIDFAPGGRLAYNFSPLWAVAVEYYADFGRVSHFADSAHQAHTLFAVVDYNGDPLNVEFGVGHGFTTASDNVVIKLILTHTF